MNIHSHLRVPMYIQQTCTLSRAAKHSQTLHALALAVAALHYSASPSLIPLLRCCSLSALSLLSLSALALSGSLLFILLLLSVH